MLFRSEVTTQTTLAKKGDITNIIEVKGKIVEDAAVTALATLSGTVESLSVDKGGYVEAGAALLTIKKVERQEPVTRTDEDGRVTTTEVPDKVTRASVYAPVSGTVSFNVIKDQETSVGMTVASVTPGTFSATGTITDRKSTRLNSSH